LPVNRFDQIEYASLTDVGVRRSHNQDNLAVQLAADDAQWRQRGHLFLVADGMGAHAVGEKASEQAASVIPHTFLKHAQQGPPGAALRKAFIEANAHIHACGQANREFQGMGTTTTALLLRPEGAWVSHVGDSRVYRVRDGWIEQLSYDHSLLWEYARIKHMDPEDVKDIPSNVIHRCLGPEPLVQIDVDGPHSVRPGDVFLLCSDGLSGQVTDAEMGAVVTVLPPAEACQFLIDLANLRGGPDNITALVVRVAPGLEANGVPAPPKRWGMPRPPWWLSTLAVGVFLAAVATAMQVNDWSGGLFVFLLASAAIIAGLAGLGLHYRQERQKQTEEEEEPASAPHIHRRAACRIEQPLLDRLARAVTILKQRAEDSGWAPDWSVYEQHRAKADEFHAAGDLAAAFREYCRAMLPLSRGLSGHRKKEEVFQPIWDKHTENGRRKINPTNFSP
jgi:protein phosphatase